MFKPVPLNQTIPQPRPSPPPVYTTPRAHTATYHIVSPSPNDWLLDSCASHHVTTDFANLALH